MNPDQYKKYLSFLSTQVETALLDKMPSENRIVGILNEIDKFFSRVNASSELPDWLKQKTFELNLGIERHEIEGKGEEKFSIFGGFTEYFWDRKETKNRRAKLKEFNQQLFKIKMILAAADL